MQEVYKLFMEDGDEKALKLLYDITEDELCNILLRWHKDYVDKFKDIHTNEWEMYADVITYLWHKYDIDGKEDRDVK